MALHVFLTFVPQKPAARNCNTVHLEPQMIISSLEGQRFMKGSEVVGLAPSCTQYIMATIY